MMMLPTDSTSVAAAGLLATRRGNVVADAAVASLTAAHLDLYPVCKPLGGAAGPLAVVQLPILFLPLSLSLSLIDTSADDGLRQVGLVAMEYSTGASSKQQADSRLSTAANK